MQFSMFLYIFCCLMLPWLRMGGAIPTLIHAKIQVYFYLESTYIGTYIGHQLKTAWRMLYLK